MNRIPATIGDVWLGAVEEGLVTYVLSLKPDRIFILTDSNTQALCLPHILTLLPNSIPISVSPGESSKDLDTCKAIWTEFIRNKASRQSLLITLGGGMITDLGGFAASCFQRGISLVHIPTTILAMTDAAIGGKTGVDYEGLKNYIGTIRFPSFIWIDTRWLNTLPPEEFVNGTAEIIKHAIIGSQHLWAQLKGLRNIEEAEWETLLEESIHVKVGIAGKDPYEQGIRKTLNFGHTIGHAIESHSWQSSYHVAHGQAVALGMLVESRMAVEIGLLHHKVCKEIYDRIMQLLSPDLTILPTFEQLEAFMARDKKNLNDKIGFSLPDDIGSCQWNVNVPEEAIIRSLKWLSAQVIA